MADLSHAIWRDSKDPDGLALIVELDLPLAAVKAGRLGR